MSNRKKTRTLHSGKKALAEASLSLKIETTDTNSPNVNAEDFIRTAEKWLNALKVFAVEQGEEVRWEIVDLKKSSAFIQVRPVKVRTKKPATKLVKSWEDGLRKIESTGTPPPRFTPASLDALEKFVFSVPKNAIVSVGNGIGAPITALTQHRVEEAAQMLPVEVPRERIAHGSIRGRLAVLDSWKPEERSFHLQIPLAPDKHVKCTYRDTDLITPLGTGFEGRVEITGMLHYRAGETWPHTVEVDRLRVLSRSPDVRLQDLVGLIRLPDGLDSVSYVRSLRDAE